MLANLEDLVYPSRIYGKAMQPYSDFFASLFGKELLSFGYERLSKDGFCEGVSNLPRITEIFIETKTYREMQFVEKHFYSTTQGFIYPNESGEESIYNNFRVQLNKELDLYATFYINEICLNYQHAFVWNFRAPLKLSSLTEWENQILRCFINEGKNIRYTLERFKVYYQSIRKKIAPIRLLKPTVERQDQRPVRLGERLVEAAWLTKDDLYLKNINLTNKEALYINLYLQGMSAKEIAEKMFVSRRTVEDYMKRIKQKLRVRSRSEFHAAMGKVNLWRNTL